MRHFIKYRSFPVRKLMVLILTLVFINKGNAQEDEFDLNAYRVRFSLQTTKNPDLTRTFRAEYYVQNKKDRKDRLPVKDAEIVYYNISDTLEIKLGSTSTDAEGYADLNLPANQAYLYDEEGFINVEARFTGTSDLKNQTKSISFKDLYVDLALEEVDSVKTVTVRTYTLDSVQNEIPEDDIDVIVSVGGMLSKLPVEEETTDEGSFEFEFPDDMRGDKDGNFKVYAFVDEHEDFGTVLASADSDWGVFDDIGEPAKNELWTEAAPIWMYVVLTVLLVGVWANYVYTIVKLRAISRG